MFRQLMFSGARGGVIQTPPRKQMRAHLGTDKKNRNSNIVLTVPEPDVRNRFLLEPVLGAQPYCAVLFGLGGGSVNDKCDGQVVRYGEVGGGDIVDVEASGADQV